VAELAIKVVTEVETEGLSAASRAISQLKQSATTGLTSMAQAASKVGRAVGTDLKSGATIAIGALSSLAQSGVASIGNIINKVLSLKTLLIGIATGALIKGAWDWLIDPNIQIEQMGLRVRAMVPDAKKAAEIIAFLQEQATKPGMNPQEVFAAGLEWLPMAMEAGENFGEVFTKGFEQATLISFVKGKPLSEVMSAVEEFYGGYATSLARILDLPPDVVQERMEAFGLMGKSSEELGAEHEALETRERDLGWAIQELNMAMEEGEKVQLGRVTSVTKQAAADLKEQHRLVQLTEQLEAVRKERAENEAEQQRLAEGGSEAGRTTEALGELMKEAGLKAGFLSDREETLRYQIDRVTNKFKEFLQIMGLPVTEKGLFETFKRFGDWIDEHWVQLSSFATLIGEKISGGIETMATWIGNIDWQGVGQSLGSWAESFGTVATGLGEILKVIDKWPQWAKTLLIGGALAQVTTGLPLNALKAMAFTAQTMYVNSAVVNLMGGAPGVPGTAGAGLGLGALAALAAQVAVIAGAAIVAAELVKRTPQYQAMTPEEKLRRTLRVQPDVRLGGTNYYKYLESQGAITRHQYGGYGEGLGGGAAVEVTVQPGSFKFDFHGTVSPAERQAIMDDMAEAIDEGFVKPLTKRLGAGYRR
jgi:hypothetical protein